MEIAVAERPLSGIRTRMMVSVLVATSSPACNWASSSAASGLPCASVRLSIPTSMMSSAPSLPPPAPSTAVAKWKMPPSKERTEPHATPVPRTIITAISASMARPIGHPCVTAVTSVSRGTSPGYWR